MPHNNCWVVESFLAQFDHSSFGRESLLHGQASFLFVCLFVCFFVVVVFCLFFGGGGGGGGGVSLACSTLLLVGSFSSMTRPKLSADTFMYVRRQFREGSLLHAHFSFHQEFL